MKKGWKSILVGALGYGRRKKQIRKTLLRGMSRRGGRLLSGTERVRPEGFGAGRGKNRESA